jgi:hypothetical protein
MALLRILAGFVWAVLTVLLYRWVLAFIAAVRLLCVDICRALAKEKLPGRQGKASPKQCATISDPAMIRPDPLIYDQYYLMALGFAVTWDNPDIWLELGGVRVSPDGLQPATTYDVIARIWNGSTEAPVMGLPVAFSYLSFGVGVQNHPIGSTTVNLGVKGAANCPTFAKMKWTTPAVPGHYCIQVAFAWLDDANPNNNLGQLNTQVGTAHSAATFAFQLRNVARASRTFRFETDTYALPPLPPCGTARGNGVRPPPERQTPWTPVTVPSRHNRRNYPLAEGWAITIAPANPRLAAGDEITIAVSVDAPSGFTGRQPINVHAFTETALVGGVTLYVDAS